MATHFTAIGWTVPEAARLTAVFSGTFTVGRLLAAGVSIRVRRDRLVTWALASAVVGLLAATWSSAAPLAYAITGLAFAPVYGTGVAWFSQELPAARGSTALVLAGGLIGGITVPPLIGRIIDITAPDILPVPLAAIALAATGVAITLRRLPSRSGDRLVIPPGRSPRSDFRHLSEPTECRHSKLGGTCSSGEARTCPRRRSNPGGERSRDSARGDRHR